ncbi:hypothetical protein KB559_15175 [Paenibacillus sp. Marseille-P2973]|uniref:hypothetical protein n=1 Tax=Paenibacillus TaxID=44249 RepID=UPI001B3582B2|nr:MULTISPECIES: hypothetical protein [Paenibacillus]MBQ4900175.1 hypothetical protein [Paenibacillus sp. Marseille-P2973]MDN4068715.1 hypothetical protein [Paenibacillus vini]
MKKNPELVKTKKQSLWKDETGDIGVKQIAITVAVIVVIAAVVGLIKDSFLNTWITEIWDKFMGLIDEQIK